jgi:hypothetical protein
MRYTFYGGEIAMKHITVGGLIEQLSKFDKDEKAVFVDDKYSGYYDEDDPFSVLDSVLGSYVVVYDSVVSDDHAVVADDLQIEDFKHLKDNEHYVAISIRGFNVTDPDF